MEDAEGTCESPEGLHLHNQVADAWDRVQISRMKDRPVGSVYIRDIDRKNEKGEYGIFIGEADAAGKGYGTLAAKGAIAYARDVLKLHKLSLRVFADNVGAVRSYEKAGFGREAFLKDEIRKEDGSRRDLILMAVLFPERSE